MMQDFTPKPGTSSLMDTCLRKVDSILPTPSYKDTEWNGHIPEYEVIRYLSEPLLQLIANQKVERILEQPKPHRTAQFPTEPIIALQKIHFLKPYIDQAIKNQSWALIETSDVSTKDYLSLTRSKVCTLEMLDSQQALPNDIIPEVRISIVRKALQKDPYRILVPLTASGYSSANLWLDIGSNTFYFKEREKITIYLPETTQRLSPALTWFLNAGTILTHHENGSVYKVVSSLPELEKQGLVFEGKLKYKKIDNAVDFLWDKSQRC